MCVLLWHMSSPTFRKSGLFGENNPVTARLAGAQNSVVVVVDLAYSDAVVEMVEPEEIDDCQRKKEPLNGERDLGLLNHHDLALPIARIYVFRRSAVH